MANTFKQFNPPGELDGRLTVLTIDDYDDPALNIDLGPTNLKSVRTHVATGNDVISIWDNVAPVLGSDAPDFQFPTGDEDHILILKGGAFRNGLSCTVSDVGGTILSGDPTAMNTVALVTEKP